MPIFPKSGELFQLEAVKGGLVLNFDIVHDYDFPRPVFLYLLTCYTTSKTFEEEPLKDHFCKLTCKIQVSLLAFQTKALSTLSLATTKKKMSGQPVWFIQQNNSNNRFQKFTEADVKDARSLSYISTNHRLVGPVAEIKKFDSPAKLADRLTKKITGKTYFIPAKLLGHFTLKNLSCFTLKKWNYVERKQRGRLNIIKIKGKTTFWLLFF